MTDNERSFQARHPYAKVHFGNTEGLSDLGKAAENLMRSDPGRRGEIREALVKLVASTIAAGPSVSFLNKVKDALGSEQLLKDYHIYNVDDEVTYLPTGHRGKITGMAHGKIYVELKTGHAFAVSDRSNLQPANWPAVEATKYSGGGTLQKRAPAVMTGIVKGQRIIFKNQGYPYDGRIGFVRETPAAGATMISADWDSGDGQHGMALLYAHQFQIA